MSKALDCYCYPLEGQVHPKCPLHGSGRRAPAESHPLSDIDKSLLLQLLKSLLAEAKEKAGEP